jgi:hypothetical protein
MTVYVHPVFIPVGDRFKKGSYTVVSTVAKHSDLSPFKIGPCRLYTDDVGSYRSLNMENGWQYSKVYEEHWDADNGMPTPDYWIWAMDGWNNPKAVRYPMGKGRKPVGSWWRNKLLDYVTARKTIYAPLYIEAVAKTKAWKHLKANFENHENIVLLDYDAYDHHSKGMTLTEVLNNPDRKMGHAFVLAMMLTKDPAIKQLKLRK